MGLQIGDDTRFHHREQVVQRAGILVMAVLLVLAALGLIGGTGVLSTTTARSGDGEAQVTYERFVHREADDAIRIEVDGAAVTDPTVDLEIAAGWLDGVDLKGITPWPVEQVASADAVVFRFPAEPGQTLTVWIVFRASRNGDLDGWIRTGAAEVRFGQFAYP